MQIMPDDLTDPAVVALLEEHVDELRSLSPPESTHALDLTGLQAAPCMPRTASSCARPSAPTAQTR